MADSTDSTSETVHRVVVPAPADLLVWSEDTREHYAVLALDVETDESEALGVLVIGTFGPIWTQAGEWQHWCWENTSCPTTGG